MLKKAAYFGPQFCTYLKGWLLGGISGQLNYSHLKVRELDLLFSGHTELPQRRVLFPETDTSACLQSIPIDQYDVPYCSESYAVICTSPRLLLCFKSAFDYVEYQAITFNQKNSTLIYLLIMVDLPLVDEYTEVFRDVVAIQ